MQFTKRQSVLLDRIELLTARADRFPLPIAEIWGGGSLFRLEPSPSDADCVFRYENTHRLWPWFRNVIEAYSDSPLETAEAMGLASLGHDEQETIRWWCEGFQVRDLTGPFGFIDSLPHKLTERLIKKNYPKSLSYNLRPNRNPTHGE